MFNLIKMEMHRLTHSTVTWITIIFAILTAIFGIAMTDMDIQAAQDEPPTGLIIQENTDDESTGMVAGVYVTGNPESSLAILSVWNCRVALPLFFA